MANQFPRYCEFGEFKLDSRRRILTKNDGEVHISAKNYDLLFELVKNEGRILSHDELLDTVWEGTFVEQSNLKKGISALRQILGETPESSLYIKTIPRKGYSFVAPVRVYDERENDATHVTATEIIIEEEIIEDDEPHISVSETKPKLVGNQPKLKLNYAIALLIAASISIVCAVGYWFWTKTFASNQFSEIKLETLKPQRLGTNGNVQESAISPNGKFFIYVLNDADGRQSLWLRQIGATNAIPLVPASNVNYRSINVSPDNDSIFYGVTLENSKNTLFEIPILGGTPRKILEEISSSVSFSPDGKKIAFAGDKPGVGRRLIIRNLETADEQEVYTVTGDNHGLIEPKWSPDGQKFSFIVSEKLADGRTWALSEVSANGGSPKNIIKPQKGKIYAQDWLSDGSGIIMSADLNDVRQSQIFKVSYPNGETARLTNDLLDYFTLSVSENGKYILAVQEERKANLWSSDFSKPSEAEQLTRNLNLSNRFAILPDGNFLAEIIENGTQTLSVVNFDGNGSHLFMPQPNIDRFPSVSHTENKVLFISRKSGADQVWIAEINGSNPRKLTDEKTFVANPRFSPDGQTIYFERYGETRWQLAKIPTEGGEATLAFEDSINYYDFSPDGKMLAYGLFDEQTKKWKIGLRNLSDLSPIKFFDSQSSSFIRFTPDSKSIIYNISDIFRDGGNLWIQPIDGSPAKPYLEPVNEKIYWANFSADGKKLFYTRGQTNSSAVLLTNESGK
jgi:Tol biopolymer transport system component/DNA-binding winged helix-turn-helix (wHTH) protein